MTSAGGLPATGWADARRILAVRLDAMGDVLMTTPAFRAIRASVPLDARLTLLTSASGAAAATHVPEVDDTIAAEVPWMKASRPDLGPAEDLALVGQLRDRRFDAAIVFTVHTQSPLPAAFVCRMAGIPLRLAHCRENPYGLLTDWVPEPEPFEPIRHEVRRQLDLVASVGYRTEDETLSFRVPPDAARRIRALVASLGLPIGAGAGGQAWGWAVLHPGASAPSRRYDPARFAAAARRLANEDGWRFVITGALGEVPLAEEVAAGIGAAAVPLAGRLSLAELAALLAVAPVLITNNSGPAHLAAAVGTPVVDVYALTNLQHAPWAVPHRLLNRDVPCRGCRKSICPLGTNACLDVDPDAVAGAARELAGGPLPLVSATPAVAPGADRAAG